MQNWKRIRKFGGKKTNKKPPAKWNSNQKEVIKASWLSLCSLPPTPITHNYHFILFGENIVEGTKILQNKALRIGSTAFQKMQAEMELTNTYTGGPWYVLH